MDAIGAAPTLALAALRCNQARFLAAGAGRSWMTKCAGPRAHLLSYIVICFGCLEHGWPKRIYRLFPTKT